MPDELGSTSEQHSERRAARRFRMKLPVTVRSFNGMPANMPGETQDISESGVLFYIPTAPTPHAPIEFVVELPSEVTMTDPMRATCKGRVVRVIKAAEDYAVAATIEGFTSFIRLSGASPAFNV